MLDLLQLRHGRLGMPQRLAQRDHDVAPQSSKAVVVEDHACAGRREQRGVEVRLEVFHGLAPDARRLELIAQGATLM